MYKLLFSPQAKKDAKKHQSSGLKPKVMELLQIIGKDPLQYPPEFEYLSQNLKGKISRMWTHYD